MILLLVKGKYTSLFIIYHITHAVLWLTLSASKHLLLWVPECTGSAQNKMALKKHRSTSKKINTLLTYLLNMLSVLPRVTLLSRICATVSTPSKTKFTFCHFLQKKTQVRKTVRTPRVKNTKETDNVKMCITIIPAVASATCKNI